MTTVVRPSWKAIQWLVAASWVACAIGWLLICIDVETVLVTGPVVLILGIAQIVVGRVKKRADVLWLGAAHVAICALLFLLVNALSWSPRQAQAPFTGMVLAYAAAVAVPTWQAFRRRMHTPGICDACGYTLIGLSEPRCPECGTPFPPAELVAAPAPAA
jgi:hypothetical protein